MFALKPSLPLYCLLLLLMLTGCRDAEIPLNNPDIQIDMYVMPDPPTIGDDALMQIRLQDADGLPIDDARVEIRGDMTHAGMVPVLRTIEDGENGIYEAPFDWTMGGDWLVEVIATRADGRAGRAIFAYTLANE